MTAWGYESLCYSLVRDKAYHQRTREDKMRGWVGWPNFGPFGQFLNSEPFNRTLREYKMTADLSILPVA